MKPGPCQNRIEIVICSLPGRRPGLQDPDAMALVGEQEVHEEYHITKNMRPWCGTTDRFIWQRSKEYIYPAKEIIFAYYYNRNETETVLADQLKQASNYYYPS